MIQFLWAGFNICLGWQPTWQIFPSGGSWYGWSAGSAAPWLANGLRTACLAQIQEFPVVRIPTNNIGDHVLAICKHILRLHSMREVRIMQLLYSVQIGESHIAWCWHGS